MPVVHEVIVQIIVKDINADGLPVGEKILQPVKIYRGQGINNVWEFADSLLPQATQSKG